MGNLLLLGVLADNLFLDLLLLGAVALLCICGFFWCIGVVIEDFKGRTNGNDQTKS